MTRHKGLVMRSDALAAGSSTDDSPARGGSHDHCVQGTLGASKRCKRSKNSLRYHHNRLVNPVRPIAFIARIAPAPADDWQGVGTSKGRTFHSCFLKLAHAPSKRCAGSYDVLRLNVSIGHCGLLSSHDDFSVKQFLPAEAAMVTQLRAPLGRILSAYEFAVEVAARTLIRAKDHKPDPSRVNTRNVWPWSALVPIIEEDLLMRVEADKAMASPDNLTAEAAPLDPYDNALIMPLRDFVAHPVVQDLLGDGAAMQVLGLTSYSHWAEAGALRACARASPAVRARLLSVALGRLESMVHVGLMEQLDLSVASLAATLHFPLNDTSWQALTANAFSYEAQSDEPLDDAVVAARAQLQHASDSLLTARKKFSAISTQWQAERQQIITAQAAIGGENKTNSTDQAGPEAPAYFTEQQAHVNHLHEQLNKLSKAARIVGSHEARGPAKQILPDSSFRSTLPLQQAFVECAQRARTRNANRKARSMRGLVTHDGALVEFSGAARNAISPAVLQKIRDQNPMDIVLYAHAKQILDAEVRQQKAAGVLATVPFRGPVQHHVRHAEGSVQSSQQAQQPQSQPVQPPRQPEVAEPGPATGMVGPPRDEL